jgi:hypothetical protein
MGRVHIGALTEFNYHERQNGFPQLISINSHPLKKIRELSKYWSSSHVFNKLIIISKNTYKNIFAYKKML